MNPRLVKMVYKPISKWAASRALVGRNRSRHDRTKGRFTRQDMKRILDQSWHNYDHIAHDLPELSSPGANHNIALAGLSLSTVNALVEENIEREYAIELFGDLAYQIYQVWGRLAYFLARFATRDPVKRMRMSVNSFLTFPFDQPGYQYNRHPLDEGIGVTILHCPIAEYFQTHEAVDVGLATWCDLDWGLAELWGGRLERSQTQMEGAASCPFQFKALHRAAGTISDSTLSHGSVQQEA